MKEMLFLSQINVFGADILVMSPAEALLCEEDITKIPKEVLT